jgi:hypothetical protein
MSPELLAGCAGVSGRKHLSRALSDLVGDDKRGGRPRGRTWPTVRRPLESVSDVSVRVGSAQSVVQTGFLPGFQVCPQPSADPLQPLAHRRAREPEHGAGLF